MGIDKASLAMSEKLAKNAEKELNLARSMFEKKNFQASIEHSHNSIQNIIKSLLITKNIFVKDNIISPAFSSIKEKTSINQEDFQNILKHLQSIEQESEQKVTEQNADSELNTAKQIFSIIKNEEKNEE